MPQTRMFRDRMVSMEQTLERGEKHLDFLKRICKDAFPEFDYREHVLDHERDLFVMTLESPDGRRRTVSWTRMVLFDTERLPSAIEDPSSPLVEKIAAFLKERASRSEIIVTFRHLEEGWVDTPEPRRERKRGRRGRGDTRRREDRRLPDAAPAAKPASAPPQGPRREPGPAQPPRPPGADAPGSARPGGRRRRFRRRRGRGGGRGGAGAGTGRPSPTS